MQAKSFSGPDGIALIVAIALHVALVAALLLQGATREPMPEPTRITVNFAEEVGATSTAPDPVRESQASIAPELGETAPPPIEYAPPPPLPAPAPQPTSAPAPQPRPAPRATSRPQPRPSPRASAQPKPEPRPTARASSAPRAEPTREARRSGGSRVGSDFLAGQGDSASSSETRTPADTLGPTALASLEAAIARQVKIRWQGRAPQGPDAEKLVTRVRFSLNPDGSLTGTPQAVGETLGQTPLNQNQVSRHREEAVRTIRLIGRFNLPIDVPPSQNTFTIRFEKD